MGPWHSPYRDGPNPELVEKYRKKFRGVELLRRLAQAAEEMRSLGWVR